MHVPQSLLILSLGFLAGCTQDVSEGPPPFNQFYYPTGLLHLDSAGSTDGVLYVASSNFDRRFSEGSVMAIELDALRTPEGLPLPPLGAPESREGVRQFPNLGVERERSLVQVNSFAGEMAAWPLPEGGYRLFVPSRAEGSLLQVIDAEGASLRCRGTEARNCVVDAVALEPADPKKTPKPRAPEPYGVAVSLDGQVFVTHLQAADDPLGSDRELESYLVTTQAESPTVLPSDFIPLGTAPSNSVAIGSRYAYVSGRFQEPFGDLVRLADRRIRGRVLNPGLEGAFQVFESRGIALDADESRLFVATRVPDTLVTFSVNAPDSDAPRLRVVAAVPLPAEPNEVRVLPRPGRRSVLAVTCTGADSLILYDDEVGEVVAEVTGVGTQPFGIGVDLQGKGARLYVSSFAEGRVAVVDIPDLDRPEQAQLVAQLGRPQTCLVEEGGSCEVPE